MAYQLITKHDSPNFTPGGSVAGVYGLPRIIDYITIHWWGDPSARASFDGVVSYLCRIGGNTSAHEVIEAGRVAVIVNHRDAAWHAGTARGNARTIGLELHPRASEADYLTAAERIKDLWATYGYKPLKGHRDWYNTACPGTYNLAKLEKLARGSFGVPTPAPAKPAVKPAAAPAKAKPSTPAKKTGKRLVLPAAADAWSVYPLNRPAQKKYAIGSLNPKQFGGLTYDIIRMTSADVAVIDTRDWGEVQIFVGAGTGAKIVSAAAAKVTPKKQQYVQLPASAEKWGIYPLGVVARTANIFHYLTPKQFGGLEYKVLSWSIPGQVAVIQTGVKGKVQIYVAPGTGAKIITK